MLLFSHALLSQPDNPERSFQEAVAAQQRGDSAAALRIYRTLLQHHPNTLVVRVNLAGLLVDLDQFDEAIEQYHAAVRLEPNNRDIRLSLAYAYEGKGDVVSLRRAAEALEALHKSAPGDAQAAMLLGDCYIRQQRYAEAVSILHPLEAAHSNDKDFEWLLGSAMVRSGHPAEGVGRIDSIAAQSGAGEAYLLAGEARLGMSQYDLALADAQAAIARNPAMPGGQTLLGMVLEHTGDFDHAEEAFKKALAANAEDYDAQYYMGSLLYFKRDIPGAEEHISHALRLQPTSVEARYKAALIEQTKGDLDAALRDLEAVTRRSPGWLEPHVKLAALYFTLHRPEDGTKERSIADRLLATTHQGDPTAGR